jgi:hypothetical protein
VSTFLTEAELVDLTGKKQPAAQRRVLISNGLRFFVRGDGHNSVPREQIGPIEVMRPTGPNLEALNRLG